MVPLWALSRVTVWRVADIVSQATMRCPICVDTIRREIGKTPHALGKAMLAEFDAMVGAITFPDRAGLAGHLVESHRWKLRPREEKQ